MPVWLGPAEAGPATPKAATQSRASKVSLMDNILSSMMSCPLEIGTAR